MRDWLGWIPVVSWAEPPPAENSAVLATLTGRRGAAEVRVDTDADGRHWLAVGTALPQPIAEAMVVELREVLAAFADKRIIDPAFTGDAGPEQVVVERGGQPWFVVQRDGADDRNSDGSSAWSVVWPAGHEPADPDFAWGVIGALRSITATSVVVLPPGIEPSDWPLVAGSVEISITGSGMDPIVVRMADERAWLPRGLLADDVDFPDVLRDLSPEAALNPQLLPIEAQRIERIQLTDVGTDGVQRVVSLRRRAEAGNRSNYVARLIGCSQGRAAPSRSNGC